MFEIFQVKPSWNEIMTLNFDTMPQNLSGRSCAIFQGYMTHTDGIINFFWQASPVNDRMWKHDRMWKQENGKCKVCATSFPFHACRSYSGYINFWRSSHDYVTSVAFSRVTMLWEFNFNIYTTKKLKNLRAFLGFHRVLEQKWPKIWFSLILPPFTFFHEILWKWLRYSSKDIIGSSHFEKLQ